MQGGRLSVPYFVNPKLSFVFQGPEKKYPALTGEACAAHAILPVLPAWEHRDYGMSSHACAAIACAFIMRLCHKLKLACADAGFDLLAKTGTLQCCVSQACLRISHAYACTPPPSRQAALVMAHECPAACAGNAYEARKNDPKGEWRKQAYEDAHKHDLEHHPDVSTRPPLSTSLCAGSQCAAVDEAA